MTPQSNRGARAGGAILAGAILAGVIVGAILGQPSIGFLAGTGLGVLIALLIWLRDRRR
jgi:F0F1-type ATP synthase assembly protein I